jgi:hypothetical protein
LLVKRFRNNISRRAQSYPKPRGIHLVQVIHRQSENNAKLPRATSFAPKRTNLQIVLVEAACMLFVKLSGRPKGYQ